MKTSLKLFSLLAVLAGLACTLPVGCAGSATRESTGEYVDDAAITTKVKTAFAKDDTVKALAVKVETFKGVVQLGGFVDSEVQSTRAAQLAASVPGVREVKNNIQVK
jgi:osmotically-inducible protein OsmY